MRSLVVTTTVAVLVLAGCSSSSPGSSSAASSAGSSATDSTSPAASGTAGVASAVTKVWLDFFAGSTPASTKILLLQNGQQFAAVINAQAGTALAKGTTATVTSVTQASPTTALVQYSILLGGKPALQNQTGEAVLVSGSWLVGEPSFCALLALEGSKLPACAATG